MTDRLPPRRGQRVGNGRNERRGIAVRATLIAHAHPWRSMRSPASPVRPASVPALIILGATVAFATVACGAAGATSSPPPPSAPVTSPNPTPTPVTQPNPELDLIVAGDRDVVALVVDHTGSLVKAASGAGGATMTVRWFASQVVNAGPSTIEVTWVGLPRDEQVTIEVTRTSGGIALNIIQASPPLNSDAEGSDRVLLLTFDEPVSAEAVAVTFQASNPAS